MRALAVEAAGDRQLSIENAFGSDLDNLIGNGKATVLKRLVARDEDHLGECAYRAASPPPLRPGMRR